MSPVTGDNGTQLARKGRHRCTSQSRCSLAIAVLLVGAVAACFVDRLGAPTLLLFLGLGMLLGEDGPGGIHFDNATLVRDAGSVALALILLEGGAARRRAGDAAGSLDPAVLLATLGVVITAGGRVGGRARGARRALAHRAPGRSRRLVDRCGGGLRRRERRRSAPSASSRCSSSRAAINDPFAAILVIGLVEWQTSDDYGLADGALLLVRELGLGIAGGIVVGIAAVWLLRRLPLPSAGIAPVLVVGVALAGTQACSVLGGSGLLAAYLTGLIVGGRADPACRRRARVHAGRRLDRADRAVRAARAARDALPAPRRRARSARRRRDAGARREAARRRWRARRRSALPAREQAFIAWAGLRGGVPIVFATIPDRGRASRAACASSTSCSTS